MAGKCLLFIDTGLISLPYTQITSEKNIVTYFNFFSMYLYLGNEFPNPNIRLSILCHSSKSRTVLSHDLPQDTDP